MAGPSCSGLCEWGKRACGRNVVQRSSSRGFRHDLLICVVAQPWLAQLTLPDKGPDRHREPVKVDELNIQPLWFKPKPNVGVYGVTLNRPSSTCSEAPTSR